MPLQLHRLEALPQVDLDFFKEQLDLKNEAEVKAHIARIASKAYEIYSYRCIELFTFAQIKTGLYDRMGPSSAYQRALKLCSQRENALFLEFGTFFGTTLRKAVMDGVPVSRVIGSDLHSDFWELGHELFGTTPITFPAAFIAGDAFDSAFISARGPVTTNDADMQKVPDLQSLTSLIPLQGRISAIHASSVFHLFNEEKQVDLARAIASLLSSQSGSLIFGVQLGQEVAGVREFVRRPTDQTMRFIHSPESWKKLWDGNVFPAGSVQVEAKLVPINLKDTGVDGSILVWSCTVL
ncbi:hypothetical protein E1B28_007333 [Marasmius oreades]|uniref:Uncharacterized protein n=1 Tax=Marasmius oreades TaxID=181124 RepID=A0A9P7S1H7_9AGAR|nr:uncharacterized protein E1B28_007333 [Marasmius oreades]KAG7093674.1 hypothetical protein E1B28_007333 [Marasmius oreades]